MIARKKITKKRLKKPDEFISFTQQALTFVTHHIKKMAIGGTLLILIFLTIFVFQMWEREKEEKSMEKFRFASESYQAVSSPYRESSPQEYKSLLDKFEEIYSSFPRTSSGRFSLLYKGEICLRLGEYEAAMRAYQAFLEKAGKEKLYRLFALEGLGYAYEGKKDFEKALHAYQEILRMDEISQWTNVYFNIARCYEKMGKKKEALENYRAFLKISSKSPLTHTVLRKISNLEKE